MQNIKSNKRLNFLLEISLFLALLALFIKKLPEQKSFSGVSTVKITGLTSFR